MRKDLEIVSVNYNTPDLIDRLIKSVNANSNYPYPIRIIDGSDKQPYINEVIEVCKQYDNVTLERQHWNIHHGRGMDKAVSESEREWCLIMDSETQMCQGFMDVLDFTHFIEGFPCWVDRNGSNVKKDCGYLYIHPEILLINVERYKQSKYKFIHHGAPALELMINTCNCDKLCIPDEYRSLYIRGGRGTVERFGYQL